MSITINIAGKHAVLADGQWRSVDESPRELLNNHLFNLEALPAHYPPADRERLAAQAAAGDFDGNLIDYHLQPDDPLRMPDGRLKVY